MIRPCQKVAEYDVIDVYNAPWVLRMFFKLFLSTMNKAVYRGYFMAARGYKFYLQVLKVSLTSERSERVRDTFSTRR